MTHGPNSLEIHFEAMSVWHCLLSLSLSRFPKKIEPQISFLWGRVCVRSLPSLKGQEESLSSGSLSPAHHHHLMVHLLSFCPSIPTHTNTQGLKNVWRHTHTHTYHITSPGPVFGSWTAKFHFVTHSLHLALPLLQSFHLFPLLQVSTVWKKEERKLMMMISLIPERESGELTQSQQWSHPQNSTGIPPLGFPPLKSFPIRGRVYDEVWKPEE